MNTKVTYICPFCVKRQDVSEFNLHMVEHSNDYDKNGNPLILSKTLEELDARFSYVDVRVME